MAAENANSPLSTFGLPTFGLPTSFPQQLEQSKKLVKESAKYWSDLLSFAAKRRQAEAEFVQSLAHCDAVSDLLKRQSEFIQASWSAYSSELPKAFGIPGKGAS
ncbi:MAG: hypothetical protein NVV83_00845 [Afipia sp.]|nr:hypothetical protein [Afipia sp.]